MMTDTTTAVEFSMSRTFKAPRPQVWQAWTSREGLSQWWGPKGWDLKVTRFDFRAGGIFHYAMTQSGQTMWGRFAYRDIASPERLVFVSSFSNEAGEITRAPFSATWPLEVLNVLTLSETGDGTRVDLRGGPIDATPDERKTFEGMRDSMRQGFTGTFDNLDAHLARL